MARLNKKCRGRLFFIGIVILFVCLSVIPTQSIAITSQSSYWGTAARGMGGAYTAAGGDMSGISYNPANSASIRQAQFVSDFNQLSQQSVDVQNGAIGGGARVGSWFHGFAINRTDLSFDFGNFSVTSSGLSLEYTDDIFYYNTAWNITPDIHLASNLKYYRVNTDVQDANATGYGLDLGYMQFIGDRTTLGLSMSNLIGDKDWDSGVSEDVPMEVRAGVRYRILSDAAVEFDAVYGENPGLRSLNVGGEWWIWKKFASSEPSARLPYFRYMQRQPSDRIQFGLALRSGIELETAGSEETNFSMGLGMQFGQGNLDYAFQQRSDFDNQHFFGFSASFGGAGEDSRIISGQNNARQRNRADRSTQRPTRTRNANNNRSASSSSFDQKKLSVGLLQWRSDPGISMRTDIIEQNLTQQSGLNTSVYDRNVSIERALIDDSLSDFQKNELLKQTGEDYLVTGELRINNGRYIANVVIESRDERKTFQVFKEDGGAVIDTVSSRIAQYLRQRQRNASVGNKDGRKEIPVSYSVQLGLLQWDIDEKVPFQPEKLEQKFARSSAVKSTVFERNKQLESTILHNALSGDQMRDLLQQVDQDYLVTGQITRMEDGYMGTAYLVNGKNRQSINVVDSNIDQLVEQLSNQIERRVTG